MLKKEDNKSRKLNLERSQIRSILIDYQKSKTNCLKLSTQIQSQLPNILQYDQLENQIKNKINLQNIDVYQLTKLKNKLVKCLSELFDLQNNLNTEKDRIIARKQFNNIMNSPQNPKVLLNQNINNESIPNPNQKSLQIQQKNIQEIYEIKHNSYNVPLYRIFDDTAQNKIERISKYLASLKSNQQQKIGNMKLHSQDKNHQKVYDILKDYPDYIAIKQELQFYKKKQKQLENKIKQIQDHAIQKFIQSAQIVQQTPTYKIIKIYSSQNQSTPKVQQFQPILTQQQELPTIRRAKILQFQKQIQAIKLKRKQNQIVLIDQSMEQYLDKQQCNVQEMFQRITSTLQNNQEKFKMLRQQRMKIFEKQQQILGDLEQS